MPRYDYFCTAERCGATHERHRRVDERDAPWRCPNCKAPMQRRLAHGTYIPIDVGN